jgi:pimeloyl-ACP methyl ester carboxylesterase
MVQTDNHRKRNAAILLICVILLASVGAVALLTSRGSQAVTVPPGAEAGDLFLHPCPLKLEGVEYAADCGTLVVPEVRGDPASRLIALPVRRIHSPASDPAEPVFLLDGGPGASNMAKTPEPWLLENHDFVNVGYRGVDGTPRLDCPVFAEAVRGFGGDLLSVESLDAIGEAAAACAESLQADGVDLAGYSIPEVVEDMEAARAGFGYGRIHLLSESYGTRVAQVYAYRHPQSLLRSAMIGVNPPGHFLWLPRDVDEQVEYYADLCRKDAGCAARLPDLAGTMRNVNQNMPRSWLGVPIDPGKVRLIAFALLYHRTTAPMVFDAYAAAAEGDSSGLALMSLSYDFIMPNMMVWGEFLAIGYSADSEPGRPYRADLAAPGSILGSPMAELIWGSAADYWPPIVTDDESRTLQPTDVETLLISGSIDFSTPARFAEQELLPMLHNGRHVVIAEQGHTEDFWSYQSGAAERLLTSFYDTGTADDSLYAYLPMDFHPPVSFPQLAKIALGAGLLLILGLGAAAWRIVRALRRRRSPSGRASDRGAV